MRYLEQCVSDLKAATHNTLHQFPTISVPTPTPRHYISASASAYASQTENDDDNDDDLEMPDSESLPHSHVELRSEHSTPNHNSQPPISATSSAATNTTSPALTPHTDASHLNPYNHTSYSALPSPAFMPLNYYQPYSSHSASASTAPSPNFGPQLHPPRSETMSVDIDHETTAACLLMLNTDRRGIGPGIIEGLGGNRGAGVATGTERVRGRGMSVRDLLSS